MRTSRTTILEAYARLLADEGERGATMDATARLAGVSKGGLLYHFPSKESLAEALCEHLEELVQADAQTMRTAPEGAARYYIRTSSFEGTDLDRTLVAVARLSRTDHPRAVEVSRWASELWLSVLVDAIGDADVARAVKLVGDGLYYEALLSDPEVGTDVDRPDPGDPSTGAVPPVAGAPRQAIGGRDLEGLLRVIDRLTDLAG
ncbi:helix-turn-helix domain-containing protein [Actinomyces sp.]|uniref:TetR/AcrR family transcriptional regulator n=1 Tax=Actinomyces sp. TaxID=29317 RepID=UPI00289AFC0C|nr:helix-turn-helix domain-containing protein [Actinomyces sp.]